MRVPDPPLTTNQRRVLRAMLWLGVGAAIHTLLCALTLLPVGRFMAAWRILMVSLGIGAHAAALVGTLVGMRVSMHPCGGRVIRHGVLVLAALGLAAGLANRSLVALNDLGVDAPTWSTWAFERGSWLLMAIPNVVEAAAISLASVATWCGVPRMHGARRWLLAIALLMVLAQANTAAHSLASMRYFVGPEGWLSSSPARDAAKRAMDAARWVHLPLVLIMVPVVFVGLQRSALAMERGKNRCACGYDLTGLTMPVCPECGTERPDGA